MREEIRDQLVARGYEVAEQVGQSGFKCSLAVKRTPEDEQYALAILIDDDQHYRNDNLIEQYYQRPAILKSFGWKVLPVYAKDWLHQPQKVMEQILKALEAGQTEVPSAVGELRSTLMTGAPARTGAYDHLAFRRWVLPDGAGEKFWEAATDGNKLIIRQGKTGSRGQASLKTFADDEAARNEMEPTGRGAETKGL
jgi:predicted DNA-binding WGR domain protein